MEPAGARANGGYADRLDRRTQKPNSACRDRRGFKPLGMVLAIGIASSNDAPAQPPHGALRASTWSAICARVPTQTSFESIAFSMIFSK